MFNENLVIIGTIIGSIGGLNYLWDTVKGKVQPNRVSFLLWGIAPLIAFAAQLSEGVGIQSLMTFSVGLIPLLILIGSFVNKKAEWKISRFDIVCGLFSALALVAWYITKEGTTAIFFSIIADWMAGLPTIIKSYKYPETENGWPYLLAGINGLFTLGTIKIWNFSYYGFPLSIFILSVLIFSIIQFKIGKRAVKN